MSDRSRPRPLNATQAWGRDLAALSITIEQLTAGIGGLLEQWPASPERTEQRLRELYALGVAMRPRLDVHRVRASFDRSREAHPLEHRPALPAARRRARVMVHPDWLGFPGEAAA